MYFLWALFLTCQLISPNFLCKKCMRNGPDILFWISQIFERTLKYQNNGDNFSFEISHAYQKYLQFEQWDKSSEDTLSIPKL